MYCQNLRQLWESEGPEATKEKLCEALDSGELKPEDFSIKELAESFCGYDWVRRMNPRNLSRSSTVDLMEAGEAVDVTAFSHITGQLLYTKIMQGWKQATANDEKLVETIPTIFDGEKVPWIGEIPNEGEALRPGEPYHDANFGERYIETPPTQKYGNIVPVYKETIFFDRTSQVLRIANSLGKRLGMGKSKRIWDAILGFTASYKFMGNSLNTYYTVSTVSGFTNSKGSTPLVDYTSIEQAYIMATQILDPDTGNPIQVDFKQLIVMPAKLWTARRLVNATRIETVYPGYTSTANPAVPGNVKMETTNPLTETLDVITSAIAYQRMLANGVNATNSADTWFIGNFPEAVKYRENWPITVEQAPPNNEKMFRQDIVHQTKASERGVVSIEDPRHIFKFYNG